jgi:guanine deaminase
MIMEKTDRDFLQIAIAMASEGIHDGGGPFGAVIVKDNEIIASEYNRVVLNNDSTAHAEILAIRHASSILGTHDLSHCTLYSSCEPCPMCLGAIYWSGIQKVVYATDRDDAKDAGFSDKFIYDEIVLDPSERKIKFLRLPGKEGKKVFEEWINSENKIPY